MESFIKWMGGKSRLRDEIVSLIPAHKTYVEPFGGAGWILFGKPPSPAEFLNDIDGSLINLYLAVRDRPGEFREALEGTPISELLFRRYLQGMSAGSADQPGEVPGGIPFQVLDDDSGIPSLAMAARFYYVVMNAFNGKISGSPSFSVSPGKESGFVGFYSTAWRQVSERLKRVTLLSRDFGEVLRALDRPETFFYLDPPYICASDNDRYYRCTFTLRDHGRLLDHLGELQGRFLLSYGDAPGIRKIYADYRILESVTVPGELLILNYEPPDPPFYSSCRSGVTATTEEGYQASRQRAPWTEPNCPECGSRYTQLLYRRVTLNGGSRSWAPNGYTCNSCGALFRGGVDQEGIPARPGGGMT